jgi:hypothetical protein
MTRAEDLTGRTFGRLTVIALVRTATARHWSCLCSCGQSTTVRTDALVHGRTKSCGCFYRESRWTHGLTKSREYSTWAAMIQRCTNPKDTNYPRYGARGISVCARWLESFESFLEDMGQRPPGKTIDRIDHNGNYEKANCRWATCAEQNQNRRNNRLSADDVAEIRRRLAAGEMGKTIARDFGIAQSTVSVIANRNSWKNVA